MTKTVITSLEIQSTNATPEVILDSKGIIRLRGRLIAEDPIEFFSKIRSWVREYFNNPVKLTHIEFNLEFINSAGIKALIDLLLEIKEINKKDKGIRIKINWYYDEFDEDSLDNGTALSSTVEIPFSFIKLN